MENTATAIVWQPERNYSCRGEDLRTYGKIGPVEVAMVKYEDYVSTYGNKEHVTGWSCFVYVRPWPRHSDEDFLHPTKEAAQAACQRAMDAHTALMTTGVASPDYEWL